MAEWREELKVDGEQLVNTIKELIHEGNVRHIIIRHDGHTMFEIPVTIGVVGAVVAPVLAAVGAAGALLAHCTIEVVRVDDADHGDGSTPTPDI